MIINDVMFNCNLEDIVAELQSQLRLNNIPLLEKIKDGPKDIMIQCPYHGNGQEHRPSAGLRKSDGQFHCFACGESHSLQEVISYCFGHYDDLFGSFGWKWINKNFASVQVEERKDVELDFSRNNCDCRNTISDSDSIGDKVVKEEELEQYRWIHDYMYIRGLTDEVIYLFDIGYDSKTNCITFPVRDILGRCLFIARRSVKTKYFNYPQGALKPLYGLYEYNLVTQMSESRESEITYGIDFTSWDKSTVIVCESMLDALTAWTHNRYAVALNGLGNELQFEQLRELPCRKLILATDNDTAGLRARDRIRKNITNKLITEYEFPEGYKDLNDLKDKDFSILTEVF